MAASDIKEGDVLAAVAEFDKLGREQFLTQYGFGRATEFYLLHNGEMYDSKAIVGVAHGFATGDFWNKKRLSGGESDRGAATILRKLGFPVVGGELFHLQNVRADRTHGRPAAYQYVVLLWAISRARARAPRLVYFNDVRSELADLLAPFAIGKTAPDPAMPWAALGNSVPVWWQLVKRGGSGASTDADITRLNPLGGLSQGVYWRASKDATFVRDAVSMIATYVDAEPAFVPLLEKLRLTDAVIAEAQQLPPDRFAEVADAIAAVESVTNPRRKFGSQRFTAAENKAIEERAVRVTRNHFEDVLGFRTEDVGATQSYDVHATSGKDVIKVEVKGTTTAGEAVVLTRNEVKLHLAEHPNNAFALVRNITLDRSTDPPSATGGQLDLTMPWLLDVDHLEPLARPRPRRLAALMIEGGEGE